MFKLLSPILTFIILCSTTTILHADRMDNIARAGDVVVLSLPAFAYAKTMYEGDGTGALEFTTAMTTTMATTFILKYTIDAERPNQENSRSFPSGHSSTAFASATFLQIRYGWHYGIPAYAAAGFVAWSRVYTKNHYTRDVIAGAILGAVGSYIFTDAYEDVQVAPIVDKGVYGITLSSRFSSY